MTDFTPTPWKVEENCLGVYPISAKQGPLVVQPAKAFGEGDAAFIVKAVNAHEALEAVRKAAYDYFMCAVQDEADDLECCISEKQHELAKTLRDALRAGAVGGAHD